MPKSKFGRDAVVIGFVHWQATGETDVLYEAVSATAKKRLRYWNRQNGDAGSCGNVDDLAQDITIKVWEKFPAFVGTGEEFAALVEKMIKDIKIDGIKQRIRERKRDVTYHVEAEDEDGELEEIENPAIHDSKVVSHLFRLPNDLSGIDLEICKLIREGKIQEEIAERMGMSLSGIKKRIAAMKERYAPMREENERIRAESEARRQQHRRRSKQKAEAAIATIATMATD